MRGPFLYERRRGERESRYTARAAPRDSLRFRRDVYDRLIIGQTLVTSKVVLRAFGETTRGVASGYHARISAVRRGRLVDPLYEPAARPIVPRPSKISSMWRVAFV